MIHSGLFRWSSLSGGTFTPRLLGRIVARRALPAVPAVASLNRAQPEVEIVSVVERPGDRGCADVTVRVKETAYLGRTSGAQDLRLFRDGQLAAYSAGAMTFDRHGEATVRFDGVQLRRDRQAPTAFSAYAFNTDRVKSGTAQATLGPSSSATASAARAHIVAIGVNETPDAPRLRLRFAVNDARSMADILSQRLRAAGGLAKCPRFVVRG